jgi:hypothetical protein
MRRSLSGRVCDHLRRNVYGLLAVFIALSGTAAALPGKNSVDSGDIKRNGVKSGDIRNGDVKSADLGANAVTSADVGADALTGADISEASLSGVLRCPAGMSRVADLCYGEQRAAAPGANAQQDCLEEGLRLPDTSDALLISLTEDLTIPNEIWTDFVYLSDSSLRRNFVNEMGGAAGVTASLTATPHPYRCTTPAGG